MDLEEWNADIKVALADLKARNNKGALADEEATEAANVAAKLVEEKAALAPEETTKVLAVEVPKRAVDEAAAKLTEQDLLCSPIVPAQTLELAVSFDSDTSLKLAVSSDADTSFTNAVHAGKDDATTKLARKLLDEDLLRKASSAPPVKSPTKKLSSALKNLESDFIAVDYKRKRTSTKPSSAPLPSAKRSLVMKPEKSKKKTSSSTSKKMSNKNSIKKTPLLPNGLQAIVNGKDITVFVEMRKKPVMRLDYRDVVKGSPCFKEHRNAPPEPVGSNILQNKATRYRVIINSVWIDQQVLRFAKYFGWCRDNASAYKCQEDIEGWVPEINW
eukprot:scaffold207578_cov67-Attheya_sp.AAC.2